MMRGQRYSIKLRLAALAVLVSFMAVSCPQVSSPDTALQTPNPLEPKYPVPVTSGGDETQATPVRFYLDDDYNPTETEMGKTAFGFTGRDDLKTFLAIAEEKEDGVVAYFLDDSSGMTDAMYFSGEERFPKRFSLAEFFLKCEFYGEKTS